MKSKFDSSNWIGKRFGRLHVLAYEGPIYIGEHKLHIFKCHCDCGQVKDIRIDHLQGGLVKSCGCYRQEIWSTHKQSGSVTYRTWASMLSRCRNPRNKRFGDYGGRGIKVCDRWTRFENFLADMGERPEGKSLDRKEGNGNYTPENCRWATASEQMRNRRNNHLISFCGETHCATEWAAKLNLALGTLLARLRRGWSVERAFYTK